MPGQSILLDTHALIWWATSDRSLSRKVQALIADPTTRVVVSAASAWEISTKVRLGKLVWSAPQAIEPYCVGQGFDLLPITFAHAERAGAWPQAHGDPFDRTLAAQSDVEGLPLATNDARIAVFGVKTTW